MTTLQKILLVGVVVTAWIWISSDEHNDEIQDQQHYCDMVAVFEESDGESGWPPYKPDIQCKPTVRN